MLSYEQMNALKPSMSMNESTVFFEGKALTIEGKPYLTKILKMFIDHPESVLSKKDLVKNIYFPNTAVSPRYENHARTNLVKLLSRTRQILNVAYPDWDWLPYDEQKEAWHLCRLPFFRAVAS